MTRAAMRGRQLVLPLGDGTAERLSADAGQLAALSDALHLLLAVANSRVAPTSASVPLVRDALDLVANFGPGGRLGHVVRRFCEGPPEAQRWPELAAELEFAVNLSKIRDVQFR